LSVLPGTLSRIC